MRQINKLEPERSLIKVLKKKSGRNNMGHVTAHHLGGREKRYYRDIDFKRNKLNISGKVIAFEYDPNRNVEIALIQYKDGEKRYILRPVDLRLGDEILAGSDIEIRPGYSLPMSSIPIGTSIHNLEMQTGKGGQIVRGAGTLATILAKEGDFVHIKLPSGEVRKFFKDCFATIGQIGNIEWKSEKLGKAGRARHLGRRPEVRGSAQNPRSHPHGGGEGRSGEGMKQAKTPWGKPARGLITRKKGKYSDRMILQKKKRGKG